MKKHSWRSAARSSLRSELSKTIVKRCKTIKNGIVEHRCWRISIKSLRGRWVAAEGFAKVPQVDDDASSMELDDMPSDKQELEHVWHVETMCLAARERLRELRCPCVCIRAATFRCARTADQQARAYRACV